ncbi:MAG TPA: hypothetical protein VGP17_14330 [Solirubrobacteraceae bacterium]|jgi:hypothetical protein|nr:hypothetical protein [Solirubrobacteraceae bacterium]
MSDGSRPLVVQYLYVHQPGEEFFYPTVRTSSSIARVAERYLECTLSQAATLRLQDAACDLALATNVEDRSALGRRGQALLEKIEDLGVRILPTPYLHRPADDGANYISSRYVLDAILTASEGESPERQLWLTDLDCVWVDAEKTFAAAPAGDQVGCIFIGYSPDEQAGITPGGDTRRAVGALAVEMGAEPWPEAPPWVGGELLTGAAHTLRELVRACELLDAQLSSRDRLLAAEEEVLSLSGALRLVRFVDLSPLARRITTGPRAQASAPEDPLSLGLWHLPAEKGLSFRRTAQEMLHGRRRRLRLDLTDPSRLARRFNVSGAGPLRRIQDDGWIALQRIRDAGFARSKLTKS